MCLRDERADKLSGGPADLPSVDTEWGLREVHPEKRYPIPGTEWM